MVGKNARGPLDGLKVLDLTEHMAGPYCTMILADMGAEVIKLERPGAGDSSRAMGDGSERNPYFRYINRNKKSLTLDYKALRGREIFLKLVAGMDVLVENYRPTVMDRAGLGYEALRRENPRLIYAQLSGFGSDGPYRERGGFDLIAQGMGGRSTSGSARGRASSSSARSSRRPWAFPRGRVRAGSPTTRSPRARARATARTRRTSASRRRTAT